MRSVILALVLSCLVVACTAEVSGTNASITQRVADSCSELDALCASGGDCLPKLSFCGPSTSSQLTALFMIEETCKYSCNERWDCLKACKATRQASVTTVLRSTDVDGDGTAGEGASACTNLSNTCSTSGQGCTANEFLCTASAPAPSPCATELATCKASCNHERTCTHQCRDQYKQCLASGSTTTPDAGMPSTTTYNLTYGVTAGSTGMGTVTVNPAGASCGANCATYAAGSMVTLTATPSTGSTFTKWVGCTSTTNTCTVTMSAAMAVTATFTAATTTTTYNLTYGTTAGSTGTGTVTVNPAGASCGANCATYAAGSMVTLTATPNSGSTFTKWVGCTSTTNTCTVTMSAAMTVTATFTVMTTTYNLTYGTTAGSTGTGTVTVNPAGSSCGTGCSSYAAGTAVTLTATPSTGSTFTKWVGCTSTTNTCTVTVNAAMTVTATFTKSTPTLTYTTDIAPKMTGYCNGCHGGGGSLPGNYATDSYAGLLGNGSDNTPNVIAGDVNSLFVQKIVGNHKNVLTVYPGFDKTASDWVVLSNAAK